MDVKTREWIEKNQAKIIVGSLLLIGGVVGYYYGHKAGLIDGENRAVKYFSKESAKCGGLFVKCKGKYKNFFVVSESRIPGGKK